ncbi:uncharacterized protein LOC115749094 isoform X2 [Rhodamnia argentea]|uniref:Uncharacterized protein LOC115749094 isoform X2 n=1 Tax=Rhodamnia argentea TaxID=178133 RepID=A0A8B8Q536_9MYRT|nr:uncharacterized protein LOC115749094 isoform X2 [Rhodamnia argentea]
MSSKHSTASIPYAPLPPPPPNAAAVVVVLPPYPRHGGFRLRRCLGFSAALLLVAASAFLLFPSDPAVQLTRIRLNRVRVSMSPSLTLDLSFNLTLRVQNRDLFSMYLRSFNVSVGYRGRELGFVTTEGERIRARGSSYVDTTLDLDGLQVVHDAFYLLEDLAKGVVPFDADAKVNGVLGILFVELPIKARVSCEVSVNVKNQTIAHQNCSPEELFHPSPVKS